MKTKLSLILPALLVLATPAAAAPAPAIAPAAALDQNEGDLTGVAPRKSLLWRVAGTFGTCGGIGATSTNSGWPEPALARITPSAKLASTSVK